MLRSTRLDKKLSALLNWSREMDAAFSLEFFEGEWRAAFVDINKATRPPILGLAFVTVEEEETDEDTGKKHVFRRRRLGEITLTIDSFSIEDAIEKLHTDVLNHFTLKKEYDR